MGGMSKLRWFGGSALVAYLDLCVGALIGALVFPLFAIEVTVVTLAVSAILALLPDFDLIIPVLRGHVDNNHRTTLWHRPIVVLPTATIAAWIVGGPGWGAVTFICVLWHYIHDTPPIGDEGSGIAWAWPWSERFITPLVILDPQPWDNYQHTTALEREWLTPTPRSIAEMAIGSLILLYIAVTIF